VATQQLLDCSQPELVTLERVRYFQRQLLAAEDMIADQEYFRQKMRRHNRFLHGWGVVCGLGVIPAPGRGPWQVQIDSGYALGPYGDEIYVPEPVFLDLAGCGPGADTDPCAPGRLSGGSTATGGVRFVAIKYAECLARPMLALPAGCGCDELACEYSRIRDSFQIGCLDQAPDDPHLSFDLCDPQTIVLCPPCPSAPWVVLAQVTLPQLSTTSITSPRIDNHSFRRQIYSTAILQEQLIACCCDKEPLPVESADVSIKIEAENSGASPQIAYTITVRNDGPSAANNVVVEAELKGPGIAKAYNFSPQDTWKQTLTQPFTAELGTLPMSQSQNLTFVVDAAANGEVVNTVTVKSDTHDPNEANNHDQNTTKIAVPQ
jgi:hypothetical protein